jgi:hypothetical protein
LFVIKKIALDTIQLDTVFEVALSCSGEFLEPEPGSGILGVYTIFVGQSSWGAIASAILAKLRSA